ncbi:dTDP-glucose 4,6-dehydratase [Marinilactibacillus kalidii]|uniref:dTDP-glucose 4,6-dehydratase n=1 Tax=Marinilactibacillus kalidii TaxID=2820274 RepID=UPI001ABE9A4D|nr:dTDP-glucose 4,6-dehydratase [Marinilactibacillus kalidii]
MILLVTGGAGFIGSHFIRYILKHDQNVTVVNLDKLTYAGNLKNLRSIEACERYTFVKGDITDTPFIDRLMEAYGITHVINFAAESHVDRSIVQSLHFTNTNVQGTTILLEAAKNWQIEQFIQVSTDEVYGSIEGEGSFKETDLLNPSSPYAASKASADLLVGAYGHTYGLDVRITRSTNNYGPFQYPEKLIPLMITRAMERKILPIYGDGLNKRDWIHVKDHCRALYAVLMKGKSGEIYNIGAQNERSNLEIVQTILKHTGRSDTLIQYVEDRLGHDKRYALDTSKIRSELDWAPIHTFDQGLHETIAWYQIQEDWWKSLEKQTY